MKYYIGKILERNGDFEYRTSYLFETTGNPRKHSDKMAKEWYGSTDSDYDDDEGGYWVNDTLVFSDGYVEVPEDHYNVLKNYINVLHMI